MSDTPISEISAPGNAVTETYQLAISAFNDWRKSFETHRADESRFAQALATHQENAEIKMPEEYEGIDSLQVLAQMNANKRGYLEGRFEGICQALSKVAGGDAMDWNIRIQNEAGG